MAIGHAQHPDEPAASLKQERFAAGIGDTQLDATVEGALAVGKQVRVPGSAHILERIDDDMRLMAAPALAARLHPAGPASKTAGGRLARALPRRTTWSILHDSRNDLAQPVRALRE